MLKNNIRNFLIADLISQFGAGMTLSAMTWYILEMEGSNQLVAKTVNVNTISGLLISLLAGAFVDRFSKKNVAMFSHFLRALLVLLPLLLLNQFGYESMFIFLLALSNGLGWNIYYPASKGLLQEITSKENLLKINSGAEISMQIGLFSSGAIAGSIYKIYGFNTILIISFCIFILASFLTYCIDIDEDSVNKSSSENFLELFRGGFTYLFSNKRVFLLGLVLYVPFIAANIFNTSLPGFVNQVLKSNAAIYGLIDMFYGIGACIAGLAVLGLAKKISKNRLIILGFMFTSFFGLVMFFSSSILFSFILTLLFGILGPGIRTIIYSIIMEIVPNSHLGRAMSIWNVISLTLQALITYFLGSSMDKLGASYGFIFYSVIMLLGLVMFIYTNKTLDKHGKQEDAEYSTIN